MKKFSLLDLWIKRVKEMALEARLDEQVYDQTMALIENLLEENKSD